MVGRGAVAGDADVGQPLAAGRHRGRQGRAGLEGSGGPPCRLDDQQLARLEQCLQAGPAAHGWDEDQRWTLARVAELIRREFGVCYTLRGVDYLLHRIGWSWQAPTRRAAERDETKVQAWRQETWPALKRSRRPRAPGWSSKTRPGTP
jgi:transposase